MRDKNTISCFTVNIQVNAANNEVLDDAIPVQLHLDAGIYLLYQNSCFYVSIRSQTPSFIHHIL